MEPVPRHEPEPAANTKTHRPPLAPGPPKTFREHIFHSLPRYTGPCPVGFLEIELPARQPRHFSHIRRNHEPALKLDTVLFAIFYPCDVGAGASTDASTQAPPLSRALWLPSPRLETCKGYAKFLNISHLPVTAYFALTTMFTKLPAYRNAKLLSRPVRTAESETGQTNETGEDEKPKFPVIIFSHGLGGSRTMHSAVCGELASFGFAVVAMEHRDGSSARTYVNKMTKSPDLDSQQIDRTHKASDSEEKEASKQRQRKEKAKTNPYYMVDYLFPKDNAQDTHPHNARGVDKELRGSQIEMRLAEIEEAYYVLGLINGGQGDQVRLQNLRKRGNVGSCSAGLNGINWEDWEGRRFLDNVTLMGHSFGGATTVRALRLQQYSWIRQGIILDLWGPATPESTEQERLQKPALSVGSEAFMHWRANQGRVEEICREARTAGTLAWMTTIRGSTHLSQTDFAVLYPNWVSLLMKTIVNPQRAVYLTVHSALEFLKIVLPEQQTRCNSGSKAWDADQLLSRADAESQALSVHRPADRFVAARLKIPREFSLRLRHLFNWRRNKEPDLPTDASGKPLVSLVNWGRGNELWVHLSPSEEEVHEYLRQNEV